jgi:ADP-heptose:LPS heptosyltransferase
VVTNDSGLMHVAEAVGTPVVALFGPTVRGFGYFPSLPRSAVLETNGLECRPCSRNGRRPCWRGDHACLTRIDSEAALARVDALGPWRAVRERTT